MDDAYSSTEGLFSSTEDDDFAAMDDAYSSTEGLFSSTEEDDLAAMDDAFSSTDDLLSSTEGLFSSTEEDDLAAMDDAFSSTEGLFSSTEEMTTEESDSSDDSEDANLMVLLRGYADTAVHNNWMVEGTVLVLVGVAMVLLFAKLLQKCRSSKTGEYVPIENTAGNTRATAAEYV